MLKLDNWMEGSSSKRSLTTASKPIPLLKGLDMFDCQLLSQITRTSIITIVKRVHGKSRFAIKKSTERGGIVGSI